MQEVRINLPHTTSSSVITGPGMVPDFYQRFMLLNSCSLKLRHTCLSSFQNHSKVLELIYYKIGKRRLRNFTFSQKENQHSIQAIKLYEFKILFFWGGGETDDPVSEFC